MASIVHRIAHSEQGNQRQPLETSGKAQREIPSLAPTRKVSLLPDHYINACKTAQDAIALCMNLSGYTDEQLAEWLGMSKGHISKCRKGRGNFPPNKLERLYGIAGNAAPVQYGAMRAAWQIEEKTVLDRLAEAQKRVQELQDLVERAA